MIEFTGIRTAYKNLTIHEEFRIGFDAQFRPSARSKEERAFVLEISIGRDCASAYVRQCGGSKLYRGLLLRVWNRDGIHIHAITTGQSLKVWQEDWKQSYAKVEICLPGYAHSLMFTPQDDGTGTGKKVLFIDWVEARE